jgi:hypothetical protein
MRRPRIVAMLALGVALVAVHRPADAQGTKEAARRKAGEAVELYESGRYEDAIARFREAEALFEAPQHKVYIARALAKLGRVSEALALYEAIVAQALPVGAPQSMRKAQAAALDERDELRRRVAQLAIEIRGVGVAQAQVLVDGLPVPASELDRVVLPEGEHEIVASAPGAVEARQRLTLAGGASTRVVLDLVPASTPPPVPEDRPRDWVPPLVAFGVGAVALGVGTVTGLMSISRISDLEARCTEQPNGRLNCPEEDAAEGESAGTLGTVSTAAFVIGGIAVTTGVILVVARPFDAPQSSLSVAAGPGRLSLRGRF